MYVLDTTPVDAGFPLRPPGRDAVVALVGCGGTGGFIAESLCRLLQGTDSSLYLIDPDRVEKRNTRRQNFALREVGRFKVEALARRLSTRYGMGISYSALPYSREIHTKVFHGYGMGRAGLNLVIGAVDNAEARREIARSADGSVWLLDIGNGYDSGQCLLGNTKYPCELEGAFDPDMHKCTMLPVPSLQRPDLLESPPQAETREHLDCAEAVEREEQSRTINQMMSSLASAFVERLLEGRCSWMAAYLDMEAGSLRAVNAEPETVGKLVGISPGKLTKPRQPVKGRDS